MDTISVYQDFHVQLDSSVIRESAICVIPDVMSVPQLLLAQLVQVDITLRVENAMLYLQIVRLETLLAVKLASPAFSSVEHLAQLVLLIVLLALH
jgi:hypothetical protein